MDVEARQLALQYLDRAKKADSAGAALLKEARKVNMAVASNPSDALLARRATLARDAYNARMNAEAGRTMAAYALLAQREGDRAISAQQAMARVQTAQQREVLVEEVKGGQMRRNIMLQAASAAGQALQKAPGLPASVVGKVKKSTGAEQVTVGRADMFRSEKYNELTGSFFPEDIRAAASSLKGLGGFGCLSCGWEQQLSDAIETDATAVRNEAHALAAKTASQEPGAAALAQQAEGLLAQLQQRHALEMSATGGMPWLHIVGSAVATILLLKVLK